MGGYTSRDVQLQGSGRFGQIFRGRNTLRRTPTHQLTAAGEIPPLNNEFTMMRRGFIRPTLEESLSSSVRDPFPVVYEIDKAVYGMRGCPDTEASVLAQLQARLNTPEVLSKLGGMALDTRATECCIFVTALRADAVNVLTTPGSPLRLAAVTKTASARKHFLSFTAAQKRRNKMPGPKGRRRQVFIYSALDGTVGG